MSLRVRFTPSAHRQLLAVVAYIRQDSPQAARRFRNCVAARLERVADFPASGRKLPEFPELPHREVLVTPYRFFYRVQARTIWVVGVWHDRQLASSPDEEDR